MNFNVMSEQEQRAFADTLIRTINSQRTFTVDVDFVLFGIEVDELAGSLVIYLSHGDDLVEVARPATWQAGNEEEASVDPGYDADFSNSLFSDARAVFGSLSAEVDGYQVTLEVVDLDEVETVEVVVDEVREEDSGIGSYEYWGTTGYDSQPYVEVEGTIVKACSMSLALEVLPLNK